MSLIVHTSLLSLLGCASTGTLDASSEAIDTAASETEADADADADADSDSDADSDADSDEPCELTLLETSPEDGTVGVFYRDEVTFTLSGPDPEASLRVEGMEGSSVLSEDDTVVTYTPDRGGFYGDSQVEVILDYCAGEERISFYTSELGNSVEGEQLHQRTWLLEFSSGELTEPEGVGSYLEPFLGEISLLVSVHDYGEDELELLAAIPSTEDLEEQDTCLPTVLFPTADFSQSPYFQVGPESFEVALSGYELELLNGILAGSFAEDGSWAGGLSFEGSVDTAPISESLFGSPEELCSYIGWFGASCESCAYRADEGADTCLTVRFDELEAQEVDGLTLELIEQENCHETCPESFSNPECDL